MYSTACPKRLSCFCAERNAARTTHLDGWHCGRASFFEAECHCATSLSVRTESRAPHVQGFHPSLTACCHFRHYTRHRCYYRCLLFAIFANMGSGRSLICSQSHQSETDPSIHSFNNLLGFSLCCLHQSDMYPSSFCANRYSSTSSGLIERQPPASKCSPNTIMSNTPL